MEHYFKDDETHFLIERLQNRKIRLELARLKTKNLELKDKHEEIFDNQQFSFGNTTPPSNTKQHDFTFIKDSKNMDICVEYLPQQCPICFELIWRDTNIIQCFNCDKIICNECYEKMNNECHRHEKDLKCPLCRAVLLEYYNDLSGNTLHELNIESDIENQNDRIENNESRQRDNSLLYLFLMILILIFLTVISLSNYKK